MNSAELKLITKPFWQGNDIFQESFGFVEKSNGKISTGKFLFEPTKIVSVTSTDTTIKYTEGIDFTVCGRQLIRTEKSRIPYCKFNEYMPPKDNPAFEWLTANTDPKRYVKLAAPLHHDQIIITYEHTDLWNGFSPTSQIEKLPRFSKLLSLNKPIRILFFGDSITAGCDASGCDEIAVNVETIKDNHIKNNFAQRLPSWANLIVSAIKENYHNNNITYINRAAPSSHSEWGVKNVSLVTDNPSELVIIAFGMNESQNCGSTFSKNIQRIIEEIRDKKNDTNILLVSCMCANSDVQCYANNKFKEQENALINLSDKFENVAVAKVHSVFESLADAGKLFTDYTSNNVNHPNDFAVRIYAQTILATLGI